MRAAGVEYKVLKNTMMSRACEELGITGVEEHLSGPSAFCFGYDDPVSAPKIMKEFAEKVNKTEIKGGIMDNAAIDNKVVEKLASTPQQRGSSYKTYVVHHRQRSFAGYRPQRSQGEDGGLSLQRQTLKLFNRRKLS